MQRFLAYFLNSFTGEMFEMKKVQRYGDKNFVRLSGNYKKKIKKKINNYLVEDQSSMFLLLINFFKPRK